MKLILFSVFLAHGAAVYTICTPVSGGLCQQATNKNCTCTLNVILSKARSEAHNQSLIQGTKVQKKKDSHKTSDTGKQRNGSSVASFALSEDERGTSGKTSGWQMSKDLSLKTERDTTIYFTIDARGNITNIAITPFTSATYEKVCDQLKQTNFRWCGTTPPPVFTTFKKEICIV